ncbi:MAG: nucleoside deaminase [Ilumatobacteraceae bacterium]
MTNPIIALDLPMQRAMELAWESISNGSLGIGAVITTETGEILATGRNRLYETDPGDDVLAGSSVAHAEMNALAKMRKGVGRGAPIVLSTTLQPCLQCLGAIRLSDVTEVRVLSPDPLFRGVERARDLNEFLGRRWPAFFEREVDEWAALSLLFPTHTAAFWAAPVQGWNETVPTLATLAAELVASGELVGLALRDASLDEVADALWSRLDRCVPEIAALAAQT